MPGAISSYNNRLLLIHIAKTAGTSLRRLFKSLPATASFDCIHNGILLRFQEGHRVESCTFMPHQLGPYDLAVVMMRHPIDRFRSCHQYFLNGGLNNRGKGKFPADTEVQRYLERQAPTLSSCARLLPQIARRVPHFMPASHWLDFLPNPVADLVFTGRHERFSDDVQRLFGLLDINSTAWKIERVNVSKRHDVEVLDPLAFRLAEQFYAEDFRRFGYELSRLPMLQLIQYWDQPDPPPVLLERMEQWRLRHPGWIYCRYNRSSAAAFIAENYGSAMCEAFLDIRLPAMQADVFRIAALHAKGGVWIDAATSCLEPMDRWLNPRQPLLLLRRSHQQHPHICNGVMAASVPRHPLLREAWNRISSSLLARRGQKIYRDFGPGVLRNLLATGDAALQAGLDVVLESDLQDQLVIGSSSEVLETDRHWSQRQRKESLYLSGGNPESSHC